MKMLKDEKTLHDFFYTNLAKSIEAIVEVLENTDTILNFVSLKELFHRKGVNMRYEWIVYSKIQNPRSKALIGCDLLTRALKAILNRNTSRKIKEIKKVEKLTLFDAKDKIEEIVNDIGDFMMDNYSKKILSEYINLLVKGMTDYPEDEIHFYSELQSELFFNRFRAFDAARRVLDMQGVEHLFSADLINSTINLACLSSNIFLDGM